MKYRTTTALAAILVMVVVVSVAVAGKAAASSTVAQNNLGQCNGPKHIVARTPMQWLRAISQEGVVPDAKAIAKRFGFSPRDSSFGLWLKQRTTIVRLPRPTRVFDYWCPSGKHRMLKWKHKTLPTGWPMLIVLPKNLSKHHIRLSPASGFVPKKKRVHALAQPSCGNASPGTFTITFYVPKRRHHHKPKKAHAWLSKLAYLDDTPVSLGGAEFTFSVSVNGVQTSTTTNAATGVNRDLGEFNPGDIVEICETDSGGYTPDHGCIPHTMAAGEHFTFQFVNRKSSPPPCQSSLLSVTTLNDLDAGGSSPNFNVGVSQCAGTTGTLVVTSRFGSFNVNQKTTTGGVNNFTFTYTAPGEVPQGDASQGIPPGYDKVTVKLLDSSGAVIDSDSQLVLINPPPPTK